MFNIKLTVEDNTLYAQSNDGLEYHVQIRDISELPAEKKVHYFSCSGQQLSAIVGLALSPIGETEGTVESYERIGKLFDDVPRNLRIIP